MKTAIAKREQPQATPWGVGLLGTACVLTLALATNADAQGTAIPFDTPAAYVKAGTTLDYDVSTNVSPLAARHAATEGAYGSGRAKVEAVANSNDRRGFRALAQVSSPTRRDHTPIGEATVAMDFIAQDPLGRDRVKVVVEFAAIAEAGIPLDSPIDPGGLPAGSYFEVEVGPFGTWGFLGQDANGIDYVSMPTVRGPALLKVTGLDVRNDGDPTVGFNELVIWGNGHEIERTNGRGALKYHRKIVLNVPTNYVQLITIYASAYTNGFTYIDPVVTPDTENPEVVVTLHGAVDPNPPPLGLFPPEELTAAGIDLAPLQEFGLLDAPSSISFRSPVPDATYKVGGTIRSRFRLVDGAGTAIPDAVAQDLVSACRVKLGLDAATKCVRYNAKKNQFRATVRIPKDASPGLHGVVAQVLDADGAVDNRATASIQVRARGRTSNP